MNSASLAQPDVTLRLNADGVIREAAASHALLGEGVDAWVGRRWVDVAEGAGGDKVRAMLDDALASGVSAFRQMTQRFPSGREFPMEYTIVRLGGMGGLLAIGRNLQIVTELQTRLVSAQEAMQRDYWKLRAVETRYRLLFDASSEAVLSLRAADLKVEEANPAAIRALGISPVGLELVPQLAPAEREPFATMLLRVREQGRAPAIILHLGREREPWIVRASHVTSDSGASFLLQLSRSGLARPDSVGSGPPSFDDLWDRLPDGVVTIDAEGIVLRANPAFLGLVQVAAEGSAVGENVRRWLGRPGADLPILLAGVRKNGLVRLFSTSLTGELGSGTEVEISATGDADRQPRRFGLVVRDVGHRLQPLASGNGPGLAPGLLAKQVGTAPLPELVRESTEAIERHYIEAALQSTGGNRTAAAELLGLSRQSLYAKFGRYGLDDRLERSGPA